MPSSHPVEYAHGTRAIIRTGWTQIARTRSIYQSVHFTSRSSASLCTSRRIRRHRCTPIIGICSRERAWSAAAVCIRLLDVRKSLDTDSSFVALMLALFGRSCTAAEGPVTDRPSPAGLTTIVARAVFPHTSGRLAELRVPFAIKWKITNICARINRGLAGNIIAETTEHRGGRRVAPWRCPEARPTSDDGQN